MTPTGAYVSGRLSPLHGDGRGFESLSAYALQRDVGKLVIRKVRDFETASSSLAIPTHYKAQPDMGKLVIRLSGGQEIASSSLAIRTRHLVPSWPY